MCLGNAWDEVDESNVLERLSILPTERDIAFLASHFGSISSQSEIQDVGVDVLSQVLNHSALCLESEDALFRLIERLSSEDESYRVLLDFVEAEYLSDSCIGDYIASVDPDQLSRSVWMSICRRLSLHVNSMARNRRVKGQSRQFPVPHDGSPRFAGIFHHLCAACNGNPHLSGRVEISANDEYASRTLQVYDLISDVQKTGKYWGTNANAVDHYIKIDFRTFLVRPSGYALKAHWSRWGGGGQFIRSWRFEGSNDGSNWDNLDTKSNSDAISGNDQEAVFDVATEQSYRLFRIIAQGMNSSQSYCFSMQQIEIFGNLIS
jgi:hypothetical protein